MIILRSVTRRPYVREERGGPDEPPRSVSSAAGSDRADRVSPRALSAMADGELDPLVVLEAAVAVSLDGGVVNEDVGSAVVGGYEPEPFVRVKPLNCALSHGAFFCCDDLRDRRARVPGCRVACLRRLSSGIRDAAVRTSQAL